MDATRRAVLGGAAAAALPAIGRASAPRDRAAARDAFLWGVATAAHQVEGANVNSDYWLLENLPDTGFKEPSGDACDSWARWREDVALVRSMGLNAYRFSIEWARIEPEPGVFSQAALDHYRRMCAGCREAGVTPVVTFHHFTSPRWIAAAGGWEEPATADRFARYCDRAARAVGDLIDWACTLNEPNAQVTSYIVAKGAPFAREREIRASAARAVGSDRFHAFFQGDSFKVRDVALAAHAKGAAAIKAAAPHVRTGLTLALQELSAGPGGEDLYRRIYDGARAPFYQAAAADDFIGVQTYNRMRTGPDGYLPTPPGARRDAWDRDAAPTALRAVIDEVRGVVRAPILVSENGINAVDDAQRVAYLTDTVAIVREARRDGVPLLGYIYRSLLDNFEWGSGYTPRFGLVAVDRATFARSPKPSAAAYRRLVRNWRG